MHPLLSEFLGTAVLTLIGNGVVANVVLQRTKGHDSGWIVITVGWAMAVFVGVLCSAAASGAHINPAVTLALAMTGQFGWEYVPGYMLAQVGGAMVGSGLVFAVYREHYSATDSADAKMATFCTSPAIRSPSSSLICEVLGTFVLVLAVLLTIEPSITLIAASGREMQGAVGLGTIGALPVAFVVLAVGLGLGGTTGYAINPARDLGPRLAHALLPIPGKRDSDWSYAPIPVIGPFVGGALAALMHTYCC